MIIGKRLNPPEGVKLKAGDGVTYEVIYEDGSKGEIIVFVDSSDLSDYTSVTEIGGDYGALSTGEKSKIR